MDNKQAAEIYATSLGVTAEDLMNTKVSLWDIIELQQEAKSHTKFSSVKSIWGSACIYIVRAMLIKSGKLSSG